MRWEPKTSNTIDDVTGMKVKLSETVTRWDGYQVTQANNEERQPQDFPVTPRPPRVYPRSRFPSGIAYTPIDGKDL